MNTNVFAKLTAAASALFLLNLAAPAHAGTLFGTSGIKFDQDTIVDFQLNQTYGAFTSILKVFEVNGGVATAVTPGGTLFSENKPSDNWGENNWLGTCGNTLTVCTNSFTFKAGVEYALGLSSTLFSDSSYNNTVYSTTALNPGSTQQFVFGSFGSTAADGTTSFDPTAYQSGNPFNAPLKISVDDRGNGNDADFQDFNFTVTAARTVATVPEPATLGAIGVAVVGLVASRRRSSTAKKA